ncbi:MAG TPA: hypothetical protein VJU15_06370 [Gemmatimonadales bacterium]|nr:hypothetical protein [Gemmatimonadales bacterium]
MPDRLPSLVLLVAFWVPPALAGWAAAPSLLRRTRTSRPKITRAALGAFILSYSLAWFLLNLRAIPPYIPGATMDPTFVPPGGPGWLGLITGALVFPGSVLACVLALRARGRIDGKGDWDWRRFLQEQR